MELSDKVKKMTDHWVTKFPADQKRSAVVAALLAAQEDHQGWLPQAAMDAVSDYLGLEKIEVYEVASFYDMFELKPIGKYKIGVCTNVSCMLRGSDQIEVALKKRLGINLGETTADGQFTLRETECLGACTNAPVCQINDKQYREGLTPESMLAIIDELEQESASGE